MRRGGHARGERGERREQGQAVPLLAALLAVACAVALVVAELGAAAVQRARARTAADAAALAGAAAGEAAARSVAAANGGELAAYEPTADGSRVEVMVRHGSAVARASAEAVVDLADPRGLAPAAAAALDRAEQLLGHPVEVVVVDGSGLRFAVEPSAAAALATVASRAGLCRPAAGTHPVHFAPCPPSSPG
jgi:hypothetical protein